MKSVTNNIYSISEWEPLIASRVDVEPKTLLTPRATTPSEQQQQQQPKSQQPQIAKDIDYVNAVQKAWRDQMNQRPTIKTNATTEIASVIYKATENKEDTTLLYGTLIRKKVQPQQQNNDNNSPSLSSSRKNVPGIILFHTGAGPHDIFLQWKADELITSLSSTVKEEGEDEGCIIFIADLIGDDIGWGWSSDRAKFNAARDYLFSTTTAKNEKNSKDNNNDDRKSNSNSLHLRQRVQASIDVLSSLSSRMNIDTKTIAALGWCFGGYPILELAYNIKNPNVKAMVTYHGVFNNNIVTITDDDEKTENDDDDPNAINKDICEILICNGKNDPFVTENDIATTVLNLQKLKKNYNVEVLSFDDTKHGFTNPAQDFNPNEAFKYNHDSAIKSWEKTIKLLKSTLF